MLVIHIITVLLIWRKDDSFLSADTSRYLLSVYSLVADFIALIFIAALRSRCGHHIFALWFLLFICLLSFFPRLISAFADWMSSILSHMVWP